MKSFRDIRLEEVIKKYNEKVEHYTIVVEEFKLSGDTNLQSAISLIEPELYDLQKSIAYLKEA